VDVQGDFLIIGSGIAGLRAAVELFGDGDVVILTKAEPAESNTEYAQGGIAAALGPDDSPALHAADTIAAGDGLCDERAVEILVEEGRRYVLELVEWGAAFDRNAAGKPALGREGAHSVRRVLHAKDATGREIGRLLWQQVSSRPAVRVFKDTLAIEAIIERDRCIGVRFMDRGGRVGIARARATLLATGGAGQVFRETTNPRIASGDGIALAFRAGARVADLEFVQFHPTVLQIEGSPRLLISEAVRGEGAYLLNTHGERFMPRYDPAGDLASRDVVARSIVRESDRTRAPVYLSLAHLNPSFVHERFPSIAAICRHVGLDVARDRIPVGPAAHYVMGGVETDLDGRTSLPGLFAAGEVACTRVHGANRLASNSLLEGLVFGARAGRAMRQGVSTARLPPPEFRLLGLQTEPRASRTELAEDSIRDLMWRRAGLFRSGSGLRELVAALDSAHAELANALASHAVTDLAGWQRANLLTVACLIARGALRRTESRGAHFRSDYPAKDDEGWKTHVTEVNEAEARRLGIDTATTEPGSANPYDTKEGRGSGKSR
jgi:L-aspartate oxidase